MSKTGKATHRRSSVARNRPRRRVERSVPTARQRRARHVVRHVTIAAVAAALVGVFWATRPTWDGEMRLWKAVGDAAFVLLLLALSLGPSMTMPAGPPPDAATLGRSSR